jgi:predicted DNA-binding transcriptional regulator YafY
MSGRSKTLNEAVYHSIDAIHAAINDGKKIEFMYFDYNTKKRRVYRKDDGSYTRTPVAMCWNEDKYYLITYSPKYDNHFATFRVDRMANVEVLDVDADKCDRKAFSITDYIKRTFGMYSGETVSAKIAFNESLVNVVLDHFGNDTRLTDIGGNRFEINAEVSNSPVFLGWMFQFGDKAEIIEPESLRTAMRKLIATGIGIYGE